MTDEIPSPPTSSPPKPCIGDAIYGTTASSNSIHDSGIEVSPTATLQRTDYPSSRRYYILPPNINGHGRMVLAHRTVPHVVGVVLVVGVFAWGVCCALFAFPLLGGRSGQHGRGA
ncbi:hypothetical protein ACET3X_005595 [Alternaria dauci]|uniref:Uncharacterized protein n=1 Tax=Alternaria dauci TaxID=48095 RepID=A0ABR3UKN0_9PLEO